MPPRTTYPPPIRIPPWWWFFLIAFLTGVLNALLYLKGRHVASLIAAIAAVLACGLAFYMRSMQRRIREAQAQLDRLREEWPTNSTASSSAPQPPVR